MKKIIITSLSVLFALFLINSCRKSNINGDAKYLILGSYITLDSIINENLDFSNQSATVSIMVGSKSSPVASVNVYLATGSNALDTTTWVLIKNVPYSSGVVLSVSTADISTALGKVNQTLQAGTQYVLQNQVVTTDGRYFSVSNTPSNYNSLEGYHMALSWYATAVCAFTQASSVGLYQVVTDKFWGDFAVGNLITVTAGSNSNQLLVTAYPNPAANGINRVPIIVNVDPVSDIATVQQQVAGAYSNWSYGNFSVATTGVGSYVFSCTGLLELTLDFTVAAGDF